MITLSTGLTYKKGYKIEINNIRNQTFEIILIMAFKILKGFDKSYEEFCTV